MRRLASKLFRVPILDSAGERIGRLNDIIVETSTGSITHLVLDKLDSQSFSEIAQKLPTGEAIIPISVVKFNDDSVMIDERKLKLLSLKKSLKKRAFLAKSADTSQSSESSS
jgi:sporulation protein YlmC with PRC-barrel domain